MKAPSALPTLSHRKTAPWLDLVNSEEWGTFGKYTDHLENRPWFSRFLEQWHFSPPRGERIPIADLRQLRYAIRASCEALAARRTIPSAQLHALNEFMNVSGQRQLVQRQNGLRIEFVPRARGWNWILAETARSFGEYLSNGDPRRIKICNNDDCRWIFFDSSKARTRRWCSDASCGNRDRVRRARARAKMERLALRIIRPH